MSVDNTNLSHLTASSSDEIPFVGLQWIFVGNQWKFVTGST